MYSFQKRTFRATRILNGSWDHQHSKYGSNAESAQADSNQGCTRTGVVFRPLYHRYYTIVKKKGRIYTTLTGRLLRHFFFHFHQYATDAAKLALNALRFRIILSSIGVWGALLKLSSMN